MNTIIPPFVIVEGGIIFCIEVNNVNLADPNVARLISGVMCMETGGNTSLTLQQMK